ncbi:fimbrillin family protein [Bacteroides sp. OttesenSCG-928-J23]|nr:fimbrillin family protein [Bacteroides sp. OttesenSCG-928-J23]MDL2299512.1 fimbrillin family protein [Bacteroides sp. OttesenSCG-928-E20]
MNKNRKPSQSLKAKSLKSLKAYTTAMLLLLLVACDNSNHDDIGTGTPVPIDITVDTRATASGTIYLNIDGNTKTYKLQGGTMTPAGITDTEKAANKIYVAPGTNTLPVYAWGKVDYAIGSPNPGTVMDMPVLHANPTTAVTWSADGKPSIALAMTPVTTRVKLAVTGITGSYTATLHGIATPGTDWDATDMPPMYEKQADSESVTLDVTGAYTQAMPGTVPTGAHLLTIKMVIGGKTYPIVATRPYSFLAGFQYTLAVTINNQGQAEVTDISIANFAKGDGIVIGKPSPNAKTYFIKDEESLKAFRETWELDKTAVIHGIQIADVTLNDEWTPIGTDNNNKFLGTYNGGGYSISGLKITNSTASWQGLFGYTGDGCVLANITIREPQINTTGSNVGALVGYAIGSDTGAGTTITHCAVIGGTIEGNSNTGGLVGQLTCAHIADCYTTDTQVTAGTYAGGLVGNLASNVIVAACHTNATVTATTQIGGGLVGINSTNSTIAFCYATGHVNEGIEGKDNIGGLVGWNYGANINSCYATGNATGSDTKTGSLVGINQYRSPQYSCAIGTASGGALVGSASDPQPNDTNKTEITLGTLQLYPDPITIRVWDGSTSTKTKTVNVTSSIWQEVPGGGHPTLNTEILN